MVWKMICIFFSIVRFGILNQDRLGSNGLMMVANLWCLIWKPGNTTIFSNISVNPNQLISATSNLLTDLSSNFGIAAQNNGDSATIRAPTTPWQPPCFDQVKINIDVATRKTFVAVGAIMRDYDAKLIAASTFPVNYSTSIATLEAKAMVFGINLA
ncbi:hypothetical protein M9H77_35463 [Catharanthus roseus]|uniref:Uncharacterized protein n=1 Tax=Catharanthus roseus TaxID=4058 RepID=A0ACB9ZPE1_CATRO|nr:hypothetical protein M9H77_35463 [Catharanthus roseus]